MDSVSFDELTLQSIPAGIRVTLHGDVECAATIPADKIPALKAFLDERGPDERRLGFRVPLHPLSQSVRSAFTVTVSSAGQQASARAVDLSLTGILLELDEPIVREQQKVRATLSLGKNSVELPAMVVRRDGKLMALHFPSCVRAGELDPPAELLGIYRALELDWLKSRSATRPADKH